MTILDDTFLLDKDGGNGQVWSGCLPGCTKVVQVKPTTTIKQVREAFGTHPRTAAMVHNVPGTDCNLSTKTGVLAAVKTNNRIGADLAKAFPRIDRPWYCPPHEHQATFEAWRKGGRAWTVKKKADADKAAGVLDLEMEINGQAAYVRLITLEQSDAIRYCALNDRQKLDSRKLAKAKPLLISFAVVDAAGVPIFADAASVDLTPDFGDALWTICARVNRIGTFRDIEPETGEVAAGN